MDDTQLVAIVNAEFDSAMGREGNSISAERAKAYDFYMSAPLGNEVDGSSKAKTSDVSDVIDGIMPSMLRIFSTSDNLAEFEPEGEDDIDKAEQETDAVNYVFWKRNPAFMILYTWFMDTFIQKNGIVKAWWDTSRHVSTENYEGLTIEGLTQLMEDEELEAVEQNERTIMLPQEELDETTGGIRFIDKPTTVYDVMFRRITKKGRVKIEGVPPEEYRISSDANSVYPSSARMVGHEREVTRSDAIEMGFNKATVMGLPMSSQGNTTGEERRARRRKAEEQKTSTSSDPSMENILLREAYMKVDYDGDGVAELRQIFMCGNVLLGNEEVDRDPFHVLSAKPLPHKHFGRSIADLIMDIQEINTTLLRQVLDNLYRSNNPGHGVWEQGMGESTMEDLLTSRVGRVVTFARPPQESYMPITVPFVAGEAFGAMEYFDKLKKNRTGITQETEGLTPEALKNIQQSVLARALDVSQGKIEMIARICAETGIKTLMLHIHEMLLKHQTKKMTVRLRGGKFVEVNPAEWHDRTDMNCSIGLGLGNADTNLMHLEAIWAKQRDIVANGGLGTIVKPQQIFHTAEQFVKNARLKHPSLYFTDPGDIEVPQDDGEKQLQEGLLKIEAERNQLQQQRQMLDAQQKMFKMQQDAAEMQATHAREIETLRTERERMENDFTIAMEKLANQLTEFELKYGQNVPGAKV